MMGGPTHPLWSYPTGWSNPQTVRASAVLLAAGAWDAAPTELKSAYATTLHLHFTYTRGGAAGAFDWYVEVSPYSAAAVVPAGQQEWIRLPIYAAGAVVPGADTTSNVQREEMRYTAVGATAEDFVIDLPLDGNVERYRVFAQESGNVGAPGTLGIVGELA